MYQLQFPEFPQGETRSAQTVLYTPPRQRARLVIWERDDEPDFVVVTFEAHDGDGNILVLRNGAVPRDEVWASALSTLVGWAREGWYDTHSPFDA